MNQHQFLTVWWAEAPAERVWATLADCAAWPRWWKGIKSVEVIRGGDENGVGTLLRQRWRSLVPYTLTFDIEMVRVEEERRLEGRTSGDLAGSCTWLLDQVAGGTQVRFSVDVGTTRRWMNLPVPFSGDVVRWKEFRDHHALGTRGAVRGHGRAGHGRAGTHRGIRHVGDGIDTTRVRLVEVGNLARWSCLRRSIERTWVV